MDSKQLEEQLAKNLTEGEMEQTDTEEAARKRLPIKTEIRIQAQIDPIMEETRKYRQMAEEVDDRYAKYDRTLENRESEKKDS
ncbi:hypothetical protein N0M98_15445 [Paenibacillus doosanensis]|uniref:Uncharacterized protein n=1 Tax=Paenibacillus konkukensis TaxID=2020716 RepID=A0ABY4RFA1_9BACL|nr:MULTISPECIES: hypothetical protein [Paenibacillus]MCS7461546.1 hypothetical protein [Paenibacillus doosanensis]UQZ80963.1 hypothetical protein SK3146_00119 [Paenibacillus konkukensis]